MKTKIILLQSVLILGFQLIWWNVKAQKTNADYVKEVAARSKLWNTAYNSRDSISFYTLFDSAAVVSTAAGHWIGLRSCKDICRGLYRVRPDITWINRQTRIDVYEPWHIAHETGDWVESWTQKGDTSKSVLTGKYTILWDFKNGNWVILSAIFTALSCKGSYCK